MTQSIDEPDVDGGQDCGTPPNYTGGQRGPQPDSAQHRIASAPWMDRLRRRSVIVRLIGAAPSLILGILAVYEFYSAHQLAQDCASLSICPKSTAAEIAQLTDSAIELALAAFAAFLGFAYIATRSRRHAFGIPEWKDETDPRLLGGILDKLAENESVTSVSERLNTVIPALERRADSQASEFDGLSTRSAVILGFVSLLLAGTFGTFASAGVAASGWKEGAMIALLMAAVLLLTCVVTGWGSREFLVDRWVRGSDVTANELKLAEAKALISTVSSNGTTLAWVRGFFYSGVAVWGIGLLLLSIGVFIG